MGHAPALVAGGPGASGGGDKRPDAGPMLPDAVSAARPDATRVQAAPPALPAEQRVALEMAY